ncbi:MAG: hypothetical protein M3068_10680 [Gemmatimonadota bacterium]|nr:hypothetical protein [Gemmatimonadota bacterium]
MPLWSKLKEELDRAGRVAQVALDEGRVRLDALRARQLADRAAQALGYALYRSRQEGRDLDAETYARLSSVLAGHEADAGRLDAQIAEVVARRRGESHRAAAPPPAQ